MKIKRGYFNSYRISDSNILTESYRRTRYFSSTGIRSGAGTTVFISHKHSDLETAGDMNDLKGLLNYLKDKYHIVPYIDSMDKKMPNETCVETAERIKEVINFSEKFILLATNAAIASKWCNYLGLERRFIKIEGRFVKEKKAGGDTTELQYDFDVKGVMSDTRATFLAMGSTSTWPFYIAIIVVVGVIGVV